MKRPYSIQPRVKPENRLLTFRARTRHKIPWTDQEVAFLEQWWYQKGPAYCAAYLHRSYEDVHNVAVNELGLKDPEKLLDKEYRRVKAKA